MTLWTVACQAPLSMGFSRQEYWSRLPFSSPGDFPNSGIKPKSPALQADYLPSEPPEKPTQKKWTQYTRNSHQPDWQIKQVPCLPSTHFCWCWCFFCSCLFYAPLEKVMATLSSILAWRIPWTEEPGRLQFMESQRVRHDWVTNVHTHTYFMHRLHMNVFIYNKQKCIACFKNCIPL